MTIGAGIAIAGVWIFAGVVCASRSVSGLGFVIAVIVAMAAMAVILGVVRV